MKRKEPKPPKRPGGYDVGYGRPPVHTRFKPGESGNPRGRPKGSLNLISLLRKALHDRVEVVKQGRVKRISKFELALTQMVNRAVKGDARAMQQILQLAPLIEASAAAAQQRLDSDETAVFDSILRDLRNE